MDDKERRRIAEAAQAASPSPWSLGLVGTDEAQIPPHLAHIEASDPMAVIGMLDRIDAKDAEIARLRNTMLEWQRLSEAADDREVAARKALAALQADLAAANLRAEVAEAYSESRANTLTRCRLLAERWTTLNNPMFFAKDLLNVLNGQVGGGFKRTECAHCGVYLRTVDKRWKYEAVEGSLIFCKAHRNGDGYHEAARKLAGLEE